MGSPQPSVFEHGAAKVPLSFPWPTPATTENYERILSAYGHVYRLDERPTRGKLWTELAQSAVAVYVVRDRTDETYKLLAYDVHGNVVLPWVPIPTTLEVGVASRKFITIDVGQDTYGIGLTRTRDTSELNDHLNWLKNVIREEASVASDGSGPSIPVPKNPTIKLRELLLAGPETFAKEMHSYRMLPGFRDLVQVVDGHSPGEQDSLNNNPAQHGPPISAPCSPMKSRLLAQCDVTRPYGYAPDNYSETSSCHSQQRTFHDLFGAGVHRGASPQRLFPVPQPHIAVPEAHRENSHFAEHEHKNFVLQNVPASRSRFQNILESPAAAGEPHSKRMLAGDIYKMPVSSGPPASAPPASVKQKFLLGELYQQPYTPETHSINPQLLQAQLQAMQLQQLYMSQSMNGGETLYCTPPRASAESRLWPNGQYTAQPRRLASTSTKTNSSETFLPAMLSHCGSLESAITSSEEWSNKAVSLKPDSHHLEDSTFNDMVAAFAPIDSAENTGDETPKHE